MAKPRTRPEWDWVWRKADIAVLVGKGIQQVDFVKNQMSVVGSGLPGKRIQNYMGECLDLSENQGLKYTGRYAGTGRDITLACMFYCDVAAGRRIVLSTSSGNTGVRLSLGRTGGTSKLHFSKGGIAIYDLGNLIIPTAQPLFCIASYRHSDGAHNSLVKRLDTNEVATGSGFTSTTNWLAGDGNVLVGEGTYADAFDLDGALSLAYISYEFFSASYLQMWANDPFGPFVQEAPIFSFPAITPTSPTVGYRASDLIEDKLKKPARWF